MSEASGGKYGAMPLTLHQRRYDAARIELQAALTPTRHKVSVTLKKLNDKPATASLRSQQQGREAAGTAYAGASTSIAGHEAALGVSNQAIQLDFSGRMTSASILQNASGESANLMQ